MCMQPGRCALCRARSMDLFCRLERAAHHHGSCRRTTRCRWRDPLFRQFPWQIFPISPSSSRTNSIGYSSSTSSSSLLSPPERDGYRESDRICDTRLWLSDGTMIRVMGSGDHLRPMLIETAGADVIRRASLPIANDGWSP